MFLVQINPRRWFLVPVTLALLAGCTIGDQTGPTTVQQTGPTNVYVGASPAPSPSSSPAPAGFCSTPSVPVASVRFGVREGSCATPAERGCAAVDLAVGGRVTFDLTPLDSGGSPVTCHGTLDLEVAPLSGPCDVRSGGGTDFLPVVVGAAPGSCRITAHVNGGTGQVTVTVR